MFRKVMYANTIAEAELNMSTLSEDVKVKTNNKLHNYLTNMWARREGHAYKTNTTVFVL